MAQHGRQCGWDLGNCPDKAEHRAQQPDKGPPAPTCGRIVHYHFDRNGRTQTRAALVSRDPAYAEDLMLIDVRVCFVYADGLNTGDIGDRARVPYSDPKTAKQFPCWSWPPLPPLPGSKS